MNKFEIFCTLGPSSLNKDFLKFKKECNKTGSPGRIQLYEHQNIKGLLLSTAEGEKDKPGTNTQNKNVTNKQNHYKQCCNIIIK